MSARTLPSFTRADIAARNAKGPSSCYMLLGRNVYDLSDFAADHPGGAELLHDYAGKDVAAILKDPLSHEHSDAAYDVLDDCLVGRLRDDAAAQADDGYLDETLESSTASSRDSSRSASSVSLSDDDGDDVDDGTASRSRTRTTTAQPQVNPRTGMSCEEDLSRDTDYVADFRRHQFLDLSRPLLMQLWRSGYSKAFYLEQVHRPRHYKGGQSAPLFGNFLEPLSLTAWWVVPTIWLPFVGWMVSLAAKGLSARGEIQAYFVLGLFVWTLVEYGLHRFLFHLDYYLPDNRVGITAHFLMHGVHHYLPMDKYRLVMPPTLFCAFAAPFWPISGMLIFWSWHGRVAALAGGIFGYVCYDLTHYFLHHRTLPSYWRQLKQYHLQHHFLDYELGFGVTSKFWDRVFGTELPAQAPKGAKAM